MGKNKIELIKFFDKKNNLLRWTDISTGTIYFGFKNNETLYSLGVPSEAYGSKVFLEAFTNKGKNLFEKECTTNSFGETRKKTNTIKDVEDSVIRNSGFDFPVMFFKNDK